MLALLSGNQLRLNMASGLVTTLLNAAVALFAHRIFTGYLGLDVYGLWLVLATILQLAMLGDLGIGQALTKLVAEHRGQNNRVAIQRDVNAATTVLAVVSVLLVATSCVVGEPLSWLLGLGPAETELVARIFPCLAGLTACALFSQAYQALLSGLGRMDLANYVLTSGRVGGLILSMALVALGGGLDAMLVGAAAASMGTLTATTLAAKRIGGISPLPTRLPVYADVRKIVGFGGGLLTSLLIRQTVGPFNTALLCRFCGIESVPIYEIAYRLAMQLRGLIEAPLRATMPELSRASTADSAPAECIQHLERKALRIMLFTALPFYSVLILAGRPLLTLWLDDAVAERLVAPATLLLAGTAVSLVATPAYFSLIGFGRVRALLAGSLIFTATNAIWGGVLCVAGVISPTLVAAGVFVSLIAISTYQMFAKQRLVAMLAVTPATNDSFSRAA